MAPDYTISQQSDNKWIIAKWEGGAEPTQTYDVIQDKRGGLRCTCPSGRYRGWCKHTTMVRNYQKEESHEVE